MHPSSRVALVLFAALSAIGALAYADPRTFRRGSIALSIDSDDQHTFAVTATNNSRSTQGAHGSVYILQGRSEVTTCDFDFESIDPGSSESASIECSYDPGASTVTWGVRWR